MTPDDLRAWQARMGYTYDTAAEALGVSRATYAEWLAGKSRTYGGGQPAGQAVEQCRDTVINYTLTHAASCAGLAGSLVSSTG